MILPLAPGFHVGVPAAIYHSDPAEKPSLSSSLARTLLNDSPAIAFREHPKLGGVRREATSAMDTGSLAHAILADNLDDSVEVGTYENFRSKAAQAWRDSVVASGKLAALESDLDEARKIAASVHKNVCNGGITNDPFAPNANAVNEAVAIWAEGETLCRAMFDRIVFDGNGGADIWDWKVTADISPRAIERSVIKFGYHIQEAFYRTGLIATGKAKHVSFCYVFVLSSAPYTVRRVCLSLDFVAVGKREVAKALRIWRECLHANQWPDGSEETLHIEPPMYLLDDEISTE